MQGGLPQRFLRGDGLEVKSNIHFESSIQVQRAAELKHDEQRMRCNAEVFRRSFVALPILLDLVAN